MRIFELLLLKIETFLALGFTGYTTYILSKQSSYAIGFIVCLAIISSLVSLYFSAEKPKRVKLNAGLIGSFCGIVSGISTLLIYNSLSLWVTSISSFFVTLFLYSCRGIKANV